MHFLKFYYSPSALSGPKNYSKNGNLLTTKWSNTNRRYFFSNYSTPAGSNVYPFVFYSTSALSGPIGKIFNSYSTPAGSNVCPFVFYSTSALSGLKNYS